MTKVSNLPTRHMWAGCAFAEDEVQWVAAGCWLLAAESVIRALNTRVQSETEAMPFSDGSPLKSK